METKSLNIIALDSYSSTRNYKFRQLEVGLCTIQNRNLYVFYYPAGSSSKQKLEKMKFKDRKKQRKTVKDNYEVALEAKSLWEQLRRYAYRSISSVTNHTMNKINRLTVSRTRNSSHDELTFIAIRGHLEFGGNKEIKKKG